MRCIPRATGCAYCCGPAQFYEKEEIVMFTTTFPKMTKFLAVGAVAVAGLMAGVSAQAHGGVSLSIGVGVPGVAMGYGAPAPVYMAPPPVYVAPPRPVYYAPPAPVYYAPRPVYRPAPVYVGPSYGYYGGPGWRGRGHGYGHGHGHGHGHRR